MAFTLGPFSRPFVPYSLTFLCLATDLLLFHSLTLSPHCPLPSLQLFPVLGKSNSKGPDRNPDFGLNAIIKLLKTVSDNSRFEEDQTAEEEETAKTTAREKKESAALSRIAKAVKPPTDGTSFAAAAASTDHVSSDAPIVVKGEGKTLVAHLEDGKIVAEKKKPEVRRRAFPLFPALLANSLSHQQTSSIPVLVKPNVDTPPPSPPTTIKPSAAEEAADKKAKKKKAKKPVPPVPAPEDGGSYAAAANSKATADDAPVVAKGEGDALVPQLDGGHIGAHVTENKAARAGKNGSGAASWANVAKTEPDEDAPVVGEGEGGKLKSTLDHGVVVTERA
jgi:hypothetical protein